MAFFNRNGFSLHHQLVHKGLPRPALMIHGNMASGQWWEPALEYCPGQNNPVLLMDWRGCGQSSAPQTEADMNIDEIARDHLELMESQDVFASGPVDLIGHSTGGLIALRMAHLAPTRFHRLFLLDPVGAHGVKFDPAFEGVFLQMANDKNLAGAIVGSTIHQNDTHSRFYQNVVVENAFTAAKNIGLKLLLNLKDQDWSEDMKALSHETLVLHGEHDQILDINESRSLAESLPNGRFEMIPGHGHCWNAEAPKAFAERMLRFLKDGE